jgi:hypothetical protein
MGVAFAVTSKSLQHSEKYIGFICFLFISISVLLDYLKGGTLFLHCNRKEPRLFPICKGLMYFLSFVQKSRYKDIVSPLVWS